jgi:hypothetical protein
LPESAVVVHPEYRTIGASVKLLKESLPLCGREYVEMIAVMARYNPFAERAGMTKVGQSAPDKSILEGVQKLEDLGFVPYLLAVPDYDLKKLQGKVMRVKEILSRFSYPYNRRIAGAHGNYRMSDYRKWLKSAGGAELAVALVRLAQLNQPKVYLFWRRHEGSPEG